LFRSFQLKNLDYTTDEVLSDDAKGPSTAFNKDGVSQIRVFKTVDDIEKEAAIEAFKASIEENVKAEFKRILAKSGLVASLFGFSLVIAVPCVFTS
jgi:hypothetical protein